MASAAFEITPDDVESVLHSYTLRMINTRGMRIEELAADLFDEIVTERVQKAALNTSTDLDEQVTGAYAEIKDILVEIGILEF